MCRWKGRGATDVGISIWRMASPLSETREVREVSAEGNSDGVAEADQAGREEEGEGAF